MHRERESLDGCSSVHAFLSKFRPKEIVRFSVAYSCSKMRPDEFSGEDFIVTAQGIFRTGGIGIKMCEALAAQQQQRIRWTSGHHCQAQKGIEAGKEGEVMAYVVGLLSEEEEQTLKARGWNLNLLRRTCSE